MPFLTFSQTLAICVCALSPLTQHPNNIPVFVLCIYRKSCLRSNTPSKAILHSIHSFKDLIRDQILIKSFQYLALSLSPEGLVVWMLQLFFFFGFLFWFSSLFTTRANIFWEFCFSHKMIIWILNSIWFEETNYLNWVKSQDWSHRFRTIECCSVCGERQHWMEW